MQSYRLVRDYPTVKRTGMTYRYTQRSGDCHWASWGIVSYLYLPQYAISYRGLARNIQISGSHVQNIDEPVDMLFSEQWLWSKTMHCSAVWWFLFLTIRIMPSSRARAANEAFIELSTGRLTMTWLWRKPHDERWLTGFCIFAGEHIAKLSII